MNLRNHFNLVGGCVNIMATRIEEIKVMLEDLCSPYAALLWQESIKRKLRKRANDVKDKDDEEYQRICELISSMDSNVMRT